MARTKNSITLGSGLLYVKEFIGEIPEYTEIETEENRIGYIQSGCSIEYGAEFYTAKDDLGYAQKTVMTDETVLLKSGIMTFDANTLTKLTSTGSITESNGIRTLKIGGAANQDGKKYIILFHHKDLEEGDIRVIIVGKNQAGFTLGFAKDKETVVDAEFSASPMDNRGTLVTYIEYPPETAPAPPPADLTYTLTVTSGAGGSVSAGGQYAAGATVTVDATPDANYEFDGWTASGGGAFSDASSASTTFTVPAADSTVTANFTPAQ